MNASVMHPLILERREVVHEQRVSKFYAKKKQLKEVIDKALASLRNLSGQPGFEFISEFIDQYEQDLLRVEAVDPLSPYCSAELTALTERFKIMGSGFTVCKDLAVIRHNLGRN